ncbi:MAG: gliding motility-associated C-terminal domain-containing protein [Bacteroidota bacterium]
MSVGTGFASISWSTGEMTEQITVEDAGLIEVMVEDASGCIGQTSITIIENSAPTAAIAGSLSFCVGNNTILDGGTGFSEYEWSDGSGDPTLEVSIPGDYGLTVTDANGCIDSTTVVVTEEAELMPMITGATDFCVGENTVLSVGTGFETITWSTTETTEQITVDMPGEVFVTVTDASGCSGQTSVMITENPLPDLMIAGSLSFCPSGTTTLDGGAGFANYEWTGGIATQTLEVSSPGDYELTVIDANNCTATTSVSVVQQDSLSPVITGAEAFCVGENTVLSVGAGFATIDWSTTETTEQITVDMPGEVFVTVTDASGCSGSTSITITENSLPAPTITGDLSFCPGASTTLEGAAGFETYSWSDGSSQDTLAVTAAQNYGLTVTDVNGCVGETSVMVTENPVPTPVINGDLSFCVGENTLLNTDLGFADYTWSVGGNTQQVLVDMPGDVTVTVTNTEGCIGEATVSVAENSLPTPTIAGSLTFCPGTTTVLDGGAGFTEYLWSDGSMTQTLEVGTPDDIDLTVTDANGCVGQTSVTVVEEENLSPTIAGTLAFCEGESTVLDAGSGFATYTWSTTEATQEITIDSTVTVSVTVTDVAGCSGEATVTVIENPLPIPQISGSLSFCPGGTTTLDGGAGFASYEWTGNIATQTLEVSTPGDYELVVSDANGCINTTSVTVDEQPNLSPVIAGATAFCEGENTTLSVGAGFETILWSTNEATEQIVVATSETISVTVTDATGCSGEASVMITENPLPSLTISGDASFCEGGATTLDGGAGFASYTWSDNSVNQTLEVDSTATYELIVADANGCEASASFEVEVFENPMPIISGDLTFCPDESTTLQTVETYASYTWSTGSTMDSIAATTAGPIDVEVIDANGCTGSASVLLSTFTTTDPIIDGALTFCPEQTTTLQALGTFATYSWTDGSAANAITVDTAGVYGVTVTDANGCSTEAQVSADNFMVEIPSIVGDTAFCAGGGTSLNVPGTFTSYQWSTTENTPMIDVANAGTYEVTVTSADGCETSNTIAISEIAIPTADSGVDQIIDCNNTSVTLGGPTTSQGPDIIYSWAGPGIMGDAEFELNPVVDAEGTYSLVVTDTLNGCVSAAVSVAVVDNQYEPTVDVSISNAIDCINETATLDGSASMTNNTATYQWFDAAGVEIPSGDQASITTGEGGEYSLLVLDETTGCQATGTIMVAEDRDFPTAAIAPGTDLDCNTPEATLDATASTATMDISYNWETQNGANILSGSDSTTPLINQGGTYILLVENTLNGCVSRDTIEIAADFVAPTADAGQDITIDCENPTATLDGSASSTGTTIRYEWQDASTGTLISTELMPALELAGTYTLVVINDENGCEASDEVVVAQDPDDLNDIFASAQSPTCFGDTDGMIVIDSVAGGTSPLMISLDGGAFTNDFAFNNLPAGTYDITVQDISGCEVTRSVEVIDGNDLIVDIFGPENDNGDIVIKLGDTIALKADPNIVRDQIFEVDWSNTDTVDCVSCLSIDVNPSITSNYSVTVTDTNGCVASNEVTVFVESPRNVYIPNAFSPNGDGDNDVFMIFAGDDVLLIETFNIFDRWGNLVFQVDDFLPNDEDFGWNGTFEGNANNTGVYVYSVAVRFIDGSTKVFKGDVVLMK